MRNYLIEEIHRNNYRVRSIKKFVEFLNYIEHSLILISGITGCVSISAFASLVGIPLGITSSAIGLKICIITAGIKKYKSTNKERKRNMII